MSDEDENSTLVGKLPTKLTPCPKGCKAETLIYRLPDSQSRHFYCRKCRWTAPWGDTDEEARREWNTRSSDASKEHNVLHVAVCQAVGLLNMTINEGDQLRAHQILRQALVDYADSVSNSTH